MFIVHARIVEVRIGTQLKAVTDGDISLAVTPTHNGAHILGSLRSLYLTFFIIGNVYNVDL